MTDPSPAPVDDPRSAAPPPGTSVPCLAVDGVSLKRGARQVLQEVGFEVERGRALGLLGPNGAGKTSIFKVLCGLLRPESGSFRLDGRSIRPGQREFRARCGVVFQEPALDPRLTARQNLRLAARLYLVPRGTARARIQRLLERVGLADRSDEPVSRLSGGMRRRVELARSLVHDPDLLILDEPTTGLDEAAFRRVWSDLRELRAARGLTLLLTTHRAEEAEHCDRIAIVDGGRIVACDTPDRLRERVRGDLVVVDTARPEWARGTLQDRLGIEAQVLEGKLVLQRERAHEWIPRIVEALPDGAVRSIGLRRVGLGEVFLNLTGHELDGGLAAEVVAATPAESAAKDGS